ncbi:MAG: hypothetical protein BIFFINMI_03325 [Phycisphaerae bacterium]|nr:hypothetical protein [Phycisphaerae bacterium]
MAGKKQPKLKLPPLSDPQRYVDLFVVDFRDAGVGVGYTADEVAMFVEQEAWRDRLKVYRIHDARPDGRIELAGVPASRLALEAGMFFGRESESPARSDFEELRSLLSKDPPPARCRIALGCCNGWRAPWQVGLIYPAECDHAMSRYLLDHAYHGGINVVAGTGIVAEFNEAARVTDSQGFAAAADRRARTWEQVQASVGEPIQRKFA